MKDCTIRLARGRGQAPRAEWSHMRSDTHIVQQIQDEEYRKGCKWACWALAAMFAVLSIGCVMFGW